MLSDEDSLRDSDEIRTRDAKINRFLIIAAAMVVVGGTIFRGAAGFIFAAVAAAILYLLSPEGADR